MKQKSLKGFTLVELIVVIALLSILGAMATNHFIGVQAASRQAAIRADAERLAGALNAFNAAARTDITTFPGDARVVTIAGTPAQTGFSGTNYWGRGTRRGLHGSEGWDDVAEMRSIVHWSAVFCGNCGDPHTVQLRHYVNAWNAALETPAFESSGAMAADFSFVMECEILHAIMERSAHVEGLAANAPRPTEPHIIFEHDRWVVRP